MSLFFSSAAFLFSTIDIERGRTAEMRTLAIHQMISTLRRFLFLAGSSILIMAMSPLTGEAAEIDVKDGCEETCELNEAIATRTRNNATDCSITGNEQTLRSTIQPHQRTAGHVPAERTFVEEVFLRAETARTMVPAPVMINNFRIALEKYLALVNTLLPEPYLLQPFQPLAKAFLELTDPVAASFPTACSTTSLNKEKPPFHSHHIQQCVVNRKQTRSILYLDHEVPKKNQQRIEI
jgi:hypothetical protein